jgi:AraC-like DNA-binding protein
MQAKFKDPKNTQVTEKGDTSLVVKEQVIQTCCKLQQRLPEPQFFSKFDYLLVKSAVKIMKTDHSVIPTMDDLLNQLNTNEERLTRSFLQIYQCSVFGWLREERLLVGRQLVLSGLFSVTEIADMLAFADIAHFSRAFKYRFGCSPKNFYQMLDKK